MSPTRIVISNDGLGPNKGDQAILAAMLDSLPKAIPSSRLEVFPHSGMRRPGHYLAFCRALRGADVFLLGGGQSLQDEASVAFLLSGLLKIVLARLLSPKVCCYAQGVGPLHTRLGRALSRAVLSRVDLITVRDADSRAALDELGVDRPRCHVTADPSVLLEPATELRAREILAREAIPEAGGPRVAVAPRRWFHYGHYFLPMSFRARFRPVGGRENHTRLVQAIAQVADDLVADHGAQVILVPMRRARWPVDPGQDDDQVAAEIIAGMRNKGNAHLIRGDYTPAELKALLGQMDLAVGMRLHSLILASMIGTPVVGLELMPKFRPFFRSLGQESCLLSTQELSREALRDVVEDVLSRRAGIRRELLARAPALRALASANHEHLRALLSGS